MEKSNFTGLRWIQVSVFFPPVIQDIMCFHQLNESASLTDIDGHHSDRLQCANSHCIGHDYFSFLFSNKEF